LSLESGSAIQRRYLAEELGADFPGFADVTYPDWTAKHRCLQRCKPRSRPRVAPQRGAMQGKLRAGYKRTSHN